MKVPARWIWICLSVSLLLVSAEAAPKVTCGPLPSDTKPGDGCDPGTTADRSLSADLELRMTAPQTIVKPGPLTYGLRVTNNGPDAAQNVKVTSVFTFDPDRLGYSRFRTDSALIDNLLFGISSMCTCGCDNDPDGAPVCTLGSVPSGGAVQYSLQIDVSRAGVVSHMATVSSGTADPVSDNNSDSAITIVLPSLPPPSPPASYTQKESLGDCPGICPDPVYFDGFESGDTSAWSNTEP